MQNRKIVNGINPKSIVKCTPCLIYRFKQTSNASCNGAIMRIRQIQPDHTIQFRRVWRICIIAEYLFDLTFIIELQFSSIHTIIVRYWDEAATVAHNKIRFVEAFPTVMTILRTLSADARCKEVSSATCFQHSIKGFQFRALESSTSSIHYERVLWHSSYNLLINMASTSNNISLNIATPGIQFPVCLFDDHWNNHEKASCCLSIFISIILLPA